MKRLCKDITPEKEVRMCKYIEVLMIICIIFFVSMMIIDFIQGVAIDGSRIALLCADVCILCANMKNKKKAIERMEEAR